MDSHLAEQPSHNPSGPSRAPLIDDDPITKVTVHHGHKVAAYSYGSGENVLLLLNGGPGNPSIDIRKCFEPIAGPDLRIVTFDQLGTGRSDTPQDTSLWCIKRYTEEIEMVRDAMGWGRVHVLGHSWGGMLAQEYALAYPQNVRSLILEGTLADQAHLEVELSRLRAALGVETEMMMQRHEADGTTDHPEYQAALTILLYRHIVRMDVWPDSLVYQSQNDNPAIYRHMLGDNEFFCTGTLKNWSVVDRLHEIKCPVQIFVGEHDHLTPACSTLIKQHIPHAALACVPRRRSWPASRIPNRIP